MPQKCTICHHPDRAQIERDLSDGQPLRTIADQWSVSKTALIRHRDGHTTDLTGEPDQLKFNSKADQVAAEIKQMINSCVLSSFTGQLEVKIKMSQGSAGQVTYIQIWNK